MAKKSVIAREAKREKLCKQFAKQRAALKAIINNQTKDPVERMEAQQKLQKLPRDSSKTRLRARCRITGRPRGVFRKFGLSRHKLRELAMRAEIPGLQKSSW